MADFSGVIVNHGTIPNRFNGLKPKPLKRLRQKLYASSNTSLKSTIGGLMKAKLTQYPLMIKLGLNQGRVQRLNGRLTHRSILSPRLVGCQSRRSLRLQG